ncbi:hypothetical protein GCM10010377_27590 [Streptomyces viridiviolaceus]|nr:hypothetical protein GCM10010377_27590 [Streptomyces viridiviolaceus]
MAVTFQSLSWSTMLAKHWYCAESPIIAFAVAWAEEAAAAWAGAAAIRVPQVAAATAAPARAFFGAATRRRKEAAVNSGPFFGDKERHGTPGHAVRAGRACDGAGTRGGRRRLATRPEKQAGSASAITPFASGGRMWGDAA